MKPALVTSFVVGILGIPLPAAGAADPPLPQKLPPGFDAVIFAAPPMINYPTFVCPGEAGELFVSVDKNASIDTQPDRGIIVKLVDTDGDGRADQRTDFATAASPRGLAFDGEWVYCLHPPTLTRYRDVTGDGRADEQQDLVTGIGFDLTKRPPDHTSNGVTLAIDGWLYLAIGDFGFMEAKGTDGRTLRLHGGGVVRVRPDGSALELFCRGTRNIYEVAVDPWLNVFARDNTNDGGGWDIKVHALFDGAEMGYPSLFKNFADETMPTLAVYGGGSGVGGTYIQEPAVPAPFGDMLYTADWGRNAIYYHPLKGEKGAWFDIGQEVFCEIERPTNIKADDRGNIFIASWKGGEYTYKGENVGYIAVVRSLETQRKAAVAEVGWRTASGAELLRHLLGGSASRRLRAARELERSGVASTTGLHAALQGAVRDSSLTRPARVAAIFADRTAVAAQAGALIDDDSVREFIVRTLGESAVPLPTATWDRLVRALTDPNDHVKAQAVIALSRLGRREAAPDLLGIAAQAPLVDDATAVATEPRAATANVKGTAAQRMNPLEADVTGAKALYLVVTDGGDGNGVDHADWVEPLLSGPAGKKKLTDLDWTSARAGWSEARVGKNAIGQPLSVDGHPIAWGIGTHAVSVIAYDLPSGHGWTKFEARGALDDSSVRQNPKMGSVQFQVYVDDLPALYRGDTGQPADVGTDWRRALPHLASRALIRLEAYDACFAALDTSACPPATRAAALRVLRNLHRPEVVSGLISRLQNVDDPTVKRGLLTTLIRLYFREADWDAGSWGTRPDTTGPYYKKAAWPESPRIEQGVRATLARATPEMAQFITQQLQRHGVTWKDLPSSPGAGRADPQWAKDQATLAEALAHTAELKPGAIGLLEPPIAIERTLAALAAGTADAALGARLFSSQGCVACHVVEKDAAPKGPNLFDVARRYQPAELVMSLLNPSAVVAQGFPTHVIDTIDGQTYAGFIIRESGDEIVLRNMAAVTQVIPSAAIKVRHKEEKISSMTPGLVNPLQPEELAGLIRYFQELK